MHCRMKCIRKRIHLGEDIGKLSDGGGYVGTALSLLRFHLSVELGHLLLNMGHYFILITV